MKLIKVCKNYMVHEAVTLENLIFYFCFVQLKEVSDIMVFCFMYFLNASQNRCQESVTSSPNAFRFLCNVSPANVIILYKALVLNHQS